MRGHMTAVIAETMEKYKNAVYIGEDVRHGGYYLVRARDGSAGARGWATGVGQARPWLTLNTRTAPLAAGHRQAGEQVP